MKTRIILLALIILASGCSTTGHTDKNAHWGYTGNEGPEHWGTLSDNYSTCSSGVNQSPIDLSSFIESDLTPLVMNYQSGGFDVVNNGHTIQVNYQPGSKLTVDGHKYELQQFHFHSPSENLIKGKSYPLEAHLVDSDQDGNLAVVAVMFEAGNKNMTLENNGSVMPQNADEKNMLSANVSVEGILPVNLDYYRFSRSLTTPPT